MPSTHPTTKKQSSINQMPLTQLVKTKECKYTKKVMIHQSGSPLPPDDFVLFPQDVVKEKHSSVRNARPRKSKSPKSAKVPSSPMPRNHVIEPKAPTPSRQDASRHSGRSFCLEHMSTVNCTVDCANGKPQVQTKMPPKAPSPPRLPTPDLSDLEEDDLWSCCGSSWSSLGKESIRCKDQANDLWDEMEEKLTTAKAWQSRSSTDSRKAALKRDH